MAPNSGLVSTASLRGRGRFTRDDAPQPPGPERHDQDAVGELHRLGQAVCDQQRGLAQLLLDLVTLPPSSSRVCSSNEANGSSISRIAAARQACARWTRAGACPPDNSDG